MNPNDRRYTREHEWIVVEDAGARRALVGITHFAQDQLGDIVYFELPKVGNSVSHLGKMGEVESVKPYRTSIPLSAARLSRSTPPWPTVRS